MAPAGAGLPRKTTAEPAGDTADDTLGPGGLSNPAGANRCFLNAALQMVALDDKKNADFDAIIAALADEVAA